MDDIVRFARNSKLVIFAGAGISRPAPSSIPTATEIIDEIINLLLNANKFTSDIEKIIRDVAYKVPFEAFLSILENSGAVSARE